MRGALLLFAFVALASRLPAQTVDPEIKKQQASAADAIKKIDSSKVRVFLYSLSPERASPADLGTQFRGYPVRGMTEIVSAREKDDLLGALVKGVQDGYGGARCFNPRHGLRAISEHATNEFLICFECSWVHAYGSGADAPFSGKAGAQPEIFSINSSATDLFNAYVSGYHLKERQFIFWGAVVVGVVIALVAGRLLLRMLARRAGGSRMVAASK